MVQNKQFDLKLQDYKSRCSYVKSYSGFLKQLVQSPEPYSWKIVDFLIVTAQSQDKMHFRQLREQIQRSVRNIKSFTMLIYVYYLKQTRNDFSFYNIFWKGEYSQVAIQLSDITIFSSWILTHYSAQIVQQTLWLVIKIFPTFLKNEFINFGQTELNCIIEWVTYFETRDPDTDKFIDVCQIIKVAKETRFSAANIHEKYILLKKFIQVVCQCKNPSSNLFLFIYPMPLMEQQITYFCQIYSDFLSDLSEDGLCTFFYAITKGAICKQALLFIEKLSYILANQQQYFKLRYLYQNFILSILSKRAKSCSKVQQLVYQITSLYVLGFLRHCDIGEIGVQCLCKNIGKLTNQNIKMKWIQLFSAIIQKYPYLKEQMTKLLHNQLGRQVELNLINFSNQLQQQNSIWNVTLRNGRKHKKYLKTASKKLGILNRNNQCYIITVVHGLQKNEFFQKLLNDLRDLIKGKFKLLDELRILFNQILGNKKAQKIGVNYLKSVGPQQFVKSQHQEDAYQYLIKLLDCIEISLKSIPAALQKFKNIFQIQQQSTIYCAKCKNYKITTNKAYVHTISNLAILCEITQELLNDYVCPDCKNLNSCFMRTKLLSKSKVLIVHINRFSTAIDGKIKKELSTQRILRKFLIYQLDGIICHKGKTVERGHYVYFQRITSKRWVQFNDSQVQEFELDKPYQQFQRQWKSQMTPYILFYKESNE